MEYKPTNFRRYNTPPEEQTMAQIEYHGRTHGNYGWADQPDDRWTPEQIQAYGKAYNEARKEFLKRF